MADNGRALLTAALGFLQAAAARTSELSAPYLRTTRRAQSGRRARR